MPNPLLPQVLHDQRVAQPGHGGTGAAETSRGADAASSGYTLYATVQF